MEGTSSQRKRLPPRWFIRFAWAVRRAIAPAHRWATRPVAGQARALGNDETDDRRPQDREDAQRDPRLLRGWSNLVTMAMNGWGAPEPAWWLNLQAQPNAQVELKSGTRAVRGRAAGATARAPLGEFREFGDDPDDYAYRRPGRTEVVVLEPASSTAAQPHEDNSA